MNERSPRVSVVTIVLDGERFLADAIESVQAQTDPDWELVVVDDGSTDRTPAIAQAFADADPRVRIVRHPGGQNRGMSASRNLGVAESRGEYVAFLDADDVYRPEKLARQAALLDAHPEADMVYGPSENWYSWTGRPEDAGRDVERRLGVEPETLNAPPSLARAWLSGEAQTPGTCGVLIRREAIEAVGGFEEDFRGLYEDQVFFFKLALRTPIYVHGESLDRYRHHPGSTIHQLYARGLYTGNRPTKARHHFLSWLESHLAEAGIEDDEMAHVLRRRLWPYRHPVLSAAAAPVRAGRRAWVYLRNATTQ